MKSAIKFLREVKLELSRIEWPTFNDFTGSTMVVLFLVLLFTIFLGLIDIGIVWIAEKIFSYGL